MIIAAEAGTSHNGSISHAERMIAAAKEAGADIIKFQYVIADEIVHPASGAIKLPGGMISIYQRFKNLECPPDFYAELIRLCSQYQIGFLCTPFGLVSAEKLFQMGAGQLKIASPELNHTTLLKKVQSFNIPLILSTGVSQTGDIEKALRIAGNTEILLHCVTSYPAPETDYNLRIIPKLALEFGRKAGVSDHSLDPVLVPVLALACGAVMLEKHFTLSNEGSGLDDPIALNPESLKTMVKAVRAAENEKPDEIIHEYKKRYGAEKTELVLGDGNKRLTASEAENYYTTRRSVLARKNIKKGEILDYSNCGIFRSEKNLKPGMEPADFENYCGKTARLDIFSGEPVKKELFM